MPAWWQRRLTLTNDLPEIADFDELLRCLERNPVMFVRYSHGPEQDAAEASCDHASGQRLPGLSVNPLTPPVWWTERPLEEWIARQVSSYAHLWRRGSDKRAWILLGRIVARGPDNEPLVDSAVPLAWLSNTLITQATERAPRSRRPED